MSMPPPTRRSINAPKALAALRLASRMKLPDLAEAAELKRVACHHCGGLDKDVCEACGSSGWETEVGYLVSGFFVRDLFSLAAQLGELGGRQISGTGMDAVFEARKAEAHGQAR